MNSALANPTTAPSADPLAQLRDIHLPEAISWWPPALGWWLLLATLLLLILLAWLSVRHYQRGAIKRAALHELAQLAHRYPDQPQRLLQQLSQLLRRVALATHQQPRSLSENRRPTAEKPFWPIFVKYEQLFASNDEKMDSKRLPLATASILGQAPSVAGLSGHAWLEFLDGYADGAPFTQGIGQILSQAPYQKNRPDFEVEPLITLSRHCIINMFKRGSRHV